MDRLELSEKMEVTPQLLAMAVDTVSTPPACSPLPRPPWLPPSSPCVPAGPQVGSPRWQWDGVEAVQVQGCSRVRWQPTKAYELGRLLTTSVGAYHLLRGLPLDQAKVKAAATALLRKCPSPAHAAAVVDAVYVYLIYYLPNGTPYCTDHLFHWTPPVLLQVSREAGMPIPRSPYLLSHCRVQEQSCLAGPWLPAMVAGTPLEAASSCAAHRLCCTGHAVVAAAALL